MHAVAFNYVCLVLAPFSQVGGYGPVEGAGEGQRYTINETRTSGPTRVTGNPVYGSYPAEQGQRDPRYAENAHAGLPPVNEQVNPNVPEDPQSALAAKLLRDMLHSNPTEHNAIPLRLYDSLERSGSAQHQFEAIKAYWDWTLAIAELNGVLEEESLLGRIPAPRTSHEQAAHTASRHAAIARAEDSKLEVALQLMDMQTATGVQPRGVLRPTDIPFVSAYNTNFQRIFPNGSAPASLRKINYTLPYILKVVRSRADSLAAARQALGAAESAYQANQMPYADLLESLALLRNQRRAFLDAVHDYNFAIAEYALTAAGPGQQRETVVSMLIRTPLTGHPPYRGAAYSTYEVHPVSAEETIPSLPWQTNYRTVWKH
jgi:hypothetical protein